MIKYRSFFRKTKQWNPNASQTLDVNELNVLQPIILNQIILPGAYSKLLVFCLQTGLTPLMEAASGGYVEVGRVLLDKYADVNAPPVPSSRDTALTIAADKGHYRFVELLLSR